MRKRIIQLSKGKFEIDKPQLQFSAQPVSFQVIEGKSFTGEFTITCTNRKQIRGMVYCTDSRMTCMTPQFEGESVVIRYRYYSKGLEEGRKVSGKFVIVCNQVTCEIPFEGQVVKMYYESSVGTIKNLEDFAALARTNWSEAVKFFYHPAFSGVIGRSRKREQMLYQGLIASSNMNQSMEEFLIADGRKKPIDFRVEKTELSYYNVEQTEKQGVILYKEGWGYLEIDVVSEAPFLRIVKKNITTSDFQGSSCRYEFILDRKKLHDGKNKGCILFRSPYKQVEVQVTASRESEEAGNIESVRSRCGKLRIHFMELMIGLRTKQKPAALWAKESLACLEQLRSLRRDPMFDVGRAYVCVVNGQSHDALHLLNEFEQKYEDDEERVSNAWMMYEYVHYLIEKNPSIKKKHRAIIEEVYNQDPDDDFLFWLIFSMQMEHKKGAALLQMLEKRILAGSRSPIFFAEAYSMIRLDPTLLTKLGIFETAVLHWALNHKFTSLNLAAPLFKLADSETEFRKEVFRVLKAYYELEPKSSHIAVICKYLIKGNCFDPKYIDWYEEGINQELRITGLYEAYLQSLDPSVETELPRILKLFFCYECNLPWRCASILYRSVIDEKERDPEMYEAYRKNIGHFALEQAEAGHIDENLAVIYEEFLRPNELNDRLAYAMAELIYRCRMTVSNPNIARMLVYQWQLKAFTVVPVIGGVGSFQLYTKDFVVVFEDNSGRRFVDTMDCRLIRMMNPDHYLEPCLALAPDALPYVLHCFSLPKDVRNLKSREKASYDKFLLQDTINPAFKADLTPEIMKYYPNVQEEPLICRYLMTADMSRMSPQGRHFLLELFIRCDMMELAYERIREFGCENVPAYLRANVLTYIVQKYNGDCDDSLVALCVQTFLQGTINVDIVRYLCNSYTGPADVMLDIWEHSTVYRLRAFDLEERILITALYGDEIPEKYVMVFRDYAESGGRELIIEAYLSACAQRYFMKNTVLDPYLFQVLQKHYLKRKEQSDAEKLALLKYLSTLGKIDPGQRLIIDELLAEFTGRNMNFAFFKNLDEDLLRKYHLDDKVFLEYRSKPKTNVVVHVSRDEDGQEFKAEEMHEVYYGIYVRSFVLFFGELIRYYITEENGKKIELMESNRLMPEINREVKDGRYHMLNQMLMSRILWEDDRLLDEMQKYCEAESAAENLFDIE